MGGGVTPPPLPCPRCGGFSHLLGPSRGWCPLCGREFPLMPTPTPRPDAPTPRDPRHARPATRRALPKRRGTCLVCGTPYLRAAHSLFCSPRCKVAAYRRRRQAEKRRLAQLVSQLVLEGKDGEAQELVEGAWPPSLRPSLRRHLERELRAREELERLQARLQGLVQEALLRPRPPGRPRR